MDSVILILGWAGIISPLVLGAIGSVYGCLIAGQAACGALLEVESGYGRYIGLSALPSSQTIYGIVVMYILMTGQVPVTAANENDQLKERIDALEKELRELKELLQQQQLKERKKRQRWKNWKRRWIRIRPQC